MKLLLLAPPAPLPPPTDDDVDGFELELELVPSSTVVEVPQDASSRTKIPDGRGKYSRHII